MTLPAQLIELVRARGADFNACLHALVALPLPGAASRSGPWGTPAPPEAAPAERSAQRERLTKALADALRRSGRVLERLCCGGVDEGAAAVAVRAEAGGSALQVRGVCQQRALEHLCLDGQRANRPYCS